MARARFRSRSKPSETGDVTRLRARELADAIQHIAGSARGRATTVLDAEIIDRLWYAWVEVARGKRARRYLMRLILLQRRAADDRVAAAELARRLGPDEVRAHMPGIPPGESAEERLRREVARLAKLQPRRRGRPRKGEPKARFYAEVQRALPALGIEPVTERQLIRDYLAAVAEDKRGEPAPRALTRRARPRRAPSPRRRGRR